MSVDQNFVVDIVRQRLPFNRKKTPKGWESFNCVACQYNGEPTPDKKRRGKVIFNGSSFTYGCFRCGFKVHWRPGMLITKKLDILLNLLGLSKEEINDLRFQALRMKDVFEIYSDGDNSFTEKTQFKLSSLPERHFNIFDPTEERINDVNYLRVLKYLLDRGDRIAEATEYYWSPIRENDINKRLIIPFYYEGEIVGWTGRYAGNSGNKPKYFNNKQDGFLFNNEHLLNSNRKYLVLVEGPFDALAIDGIGYLSNELSATQIKWLNDSGKCIIMLADRAKSGKIAIEQAIENNWFVSFPQWDKGIKDADEAVRRYGTIWTVKNILDTKVNGESAIRLKSKLWIGD